MSTIKIQKSVSQDPLAFWSQGFRPFFFGAITFALISMSYWMLIYSGHAQAPITAACLTQWHAHQMVFGYSFAVIAGFLLTAVPKWTNTEYVSGIKLFSVFIFWLVSRVLFLLGDRFLLASAFFDISFGLTLLMLIAAPIFRTRNWGHCIILAKILLLLLSNIFFYASALGAISCASNQALYAGLFIIIGLILTVAVRVFPNFARIATSKDYIKDESKFSRMTGLVILFPWIINEAFFQNLAFAVISCLTLFTINSCRLWNWHDKAIWSKPLIWSLYLAIFFINLSFPMLLLSYFGQISRFLAIHCMAVGGIAFATSGFMVRVCLGHSGKNIHYPPKMATLALLLLLITIMLRVLMPIISPAHYAEWIISSQVAWILAFFVLLFACFDQSTHKGFQ